MVLAIKRRRRQIICRLRFFIAGIYMDVIVCLKKNMKMFVYQTGIVLK